MGDEFFEADAHNTQHWRYWDTCIRAVEDGFEAKVHGEWMRIGGSPFKAPVDRYMAAQIATYQFGGRPLPTPPTNQS